MNHLFYNAYLTTLFFALVIGLLGCGVGPLQFSVETQLNPNRISPLTAILHVAANKPFDASIKVLGKHPVEQAFHSDSTHFDIPVVGLYPDKENEIVLTITAGTESKTDTIRIKTYKVPDAFPIIEINALDRSKMEPGMHLVDFHFANHGKFDSRPFIFDDDGIVRWYLDLSFFGDNLWPIQRVRNGNLLLGGQNQIFEYDMLGNELRHFEVQDGHRIHHDIVELPNGDLLIPVRKPGSFIELEGKQVESLNEFLVLFNRQSGKVTKEWDMAENIDVSRQDMINTTPSDWFHMNAVVFDSRDSTILVSGKNQGLIKIGWNNELIWILSPHKSWGKSGRKGEGFETAPYLLTAVDASGKPYPMNVQNGSVSIADFDFPWGQHAPELLPNGDIILFDNGYMRNFIPHVNYSRGVQFRINEEAKTVQQIWQFGKERGERFFSMLISDVDHLPETGNRLVTAGFVANYGKIVEVNPANNEEVFEATLHFKTLNGNKTFNWGQLDIMYRSERFELKY